MRRIATVAALAALMCAVPVLEAMAGGGKGSRRRGYLYAPPPPISYYVAPVSPYEAWRAYYTSQGELSFARRNARANYYIATGRAPPSRYFGPPTNYYAEQYALEPNSYFNCPLARRGEGVCSVPDFDWPQASGRW